MLISFVKWLIHRHSMPLGKGGGEGHKIRFESRKLHSERTDEMESIGLKFENPIFIESSFIMQMFNAAFENKLIDILEHLPNDVEEGYPKTLDELAAIRTYIPNGADKDDRLVEDIASTIRDIVRINRKLPERWDYPPERKNELFSDNKSPVVDYDCARAPFLTLNNQYRIEYCIRQIQHLNFNSSEQGERIQTLIGFLDHLKGENYILSERQEERHMEINFYERFLKLCELNGIKPTPALQEMGLSSGNLQKWQNASSTVTLKTIEKVANYFNVPVRYFYDSDGESEIELESVILDEIAAVQTLMAQCEMTLNRLETIYKNLGKEKSDG